MEAAGLCHPRVDGDVAGAVGWVAVTFRITEDTRWDASDPDDLQGDGPPGATAPSVPRCSRVSRRCGLSEAQCRPRRAPREVPRHVGDQLHRARRSVVEIDLAVRPHRHHHQIRDRLPGVKLRLEAAAWPSRPPTRSYSRWTRYR